MESLLLLCALPLVWPFVAKLIWGREITLAEMSVNALAGVLVALAGWGIGHYALMADKQVLNGQVIKKHMAEVSCEHSYSCNCKQACSGSGASQSCTTTCDACHEHASDFDWILSSDFGKQVEISRVNRRGDKEPPRYTLAKVGDPFSATEHYSNYIKAAPHSLFNFAAEHQMYALDIPPYPLNIYDYHYLSRVLTSRADVPEVDKVAWNLMLSEKLKTLGPLKQVNVVLVLSGHDSASYGEALRQAWLGGKKNDVVIVLGTPRYPEIAWAQVYSWSDSEIFKVKLRDALLDLKTAQPHPVIDAIDAHVRERYVGKSMEDFEYLKYEIELSWQVWLLLAVISLLASVAVSVLFARNKFRTA